MILTLLNSYIQRVPADTKLSKLDTLRLAMTYINHLHGMVVEADSDPGAASETRERESRGGERRAHKRSWPFTHPGQAPLSGSRPKYEDNNNGLVQGQMTADTETFYKVHAAEVNMLDLNKMWI